MTKKEFEEYVREMRMEGISEKVIRRSAKKHNIQDSIVDSVFTKIAAEEVPKKVKELKAQGISDKYIDASIAKLPPEVQKEAQQATQKQKTAERGYKTVLRGAAEGTGLAGTARLLHGVAGWTPLAKQPYGGTFAEYAPQIGRDIADAALLLPAGVLGALGGGAMGGGMSATKLGEKLGAFTDKIAKSRTIKAVNKYQKKLNKLRDDVLSADTEDARKKAITKLEAAESSPVKTMSEVVDNIEGGNRAIVASAIEFLPAALGIKGLGTSVGRGARAASYEDAIATARKDPRLQPAGELPPDYQKLSKKDLAKISKKAKRIQKDIDSGKLTPGQRPEGWPNIDPTTIGAIPSQGVPGIVARTPKEIQAIRSTPKGQEAINRGMQQVGEDIQGVYQRSRISSKYPEIDATLSDLVSKHTDDAGNLNVRGLVDDWKQTTFEGGLGRVREGSYPEEMMELNKVDRVMHSLESLTKDAPPSKVAAIGKALRDIPVLGRAVSPAGEILGHVGTSVAGAAKTLGQSVPIAGPMAKNLATNLSAAKKRLQREGVDVRRTADQIAKTSPGAITGLKIGDAVLDLTDEEYKQAAEEAIALTYPSAQEVGAGVSDFLKKSIEKAKKRQQEGK